MYPRRRREELEGRFLGLMAYLEPKGERDSSMPENQRPGPDARNGALGRPARYGKGWIA